MNLATFFNYGSEANRTLPKKDDGCTQVNFDFNFNYYGNVYTKCCININGFISFDDLSSFLNPSNKYFIAAFNHDLSTSGKGSIYYRLINNSQTLNQIGLEISSLYYLNTLNFMPTNAFIVTWDSVAPYHSEPNPYASFQLIISTDDSDSFLTLNYGLLGFAADNGYKFQYGSYKTTTITSSNPEYSSNVGVSGKWIYHLSN